MIPRGLSANPAIYLVDEPISARCRSILHLFGLNPQPLLVCCKRQAREMARPIARQKARHAHVRSFSDECQYLARGGSFDMAYERPYMAVERAN